ncbi:MAG: hypothetical protein AB7K24_18245 [Gemmataceae bacterium]
MKGPDYTVEDLIYYMGLFGGIIVTYLVMEQMGVHPLLRLIVGLVVGVGLGWVCLRIYTNAISPPRQDPDSPPRNPDEQY